MWRKSTGCPNGGQEDALNGYSMELCGGTHVRIRRNRLFKIKSESAIAAGVRRIEALCGQAAKNYLDALQSKEKPKRKPRWKGCLK